MATSIIQIRMDPALRDAASETFENLGLNLPTAIRIFLNASGQVPARINEGFHHAEHYLLPVTETPVFQAFSGPLVQECVSRQTVSTWHEEMKLLNHTPRW